MTEIAEKSLKPALRSASQILRSLAVFAMLLPIRVYRYAISPYMPMNCRYWPSCSVYAAEAVARHGPVAGGWLALRRVMRCHPWGGWGYDPVPEPNCLAAGRLHGCGHERKPKSAGQAATPSMPHTAAAQDR
jgi:putative membrane protein insertion efficiency factor